MNASASAGLLSARSRSGSVGFSTTSVSLQAMNASARTVAATKRSLDIVDSSTEKGAGPPRRVRTTARRGGQALERRAQSHREGAEVRERKGIHRIDGCRTCAVQLRAARQTRLGIEAAVPGEGEQVAADDADLPIARMADRADVIREQQLAQLRVAGILHRVAVGCELIIEAAEPREAVGRRRAPVVPNRLGGLHRLPDLVDVVRQEVQVRPVEALV